MRFTTIGNTTDVLVNLETVSKIEKYECRLLITITSGNRDKYFFNDREEAKAEFEKLKTLIYDIQRGTHG